MQETTGARLRRLREVKGLTRYRLAKVSGVAESYIYRIENDEIKNPRRDTLQKLAYGLNVAVAEIIGETKPREVWSLVEQSLKAYIPVYSGLYEVGMTPIDHIVFSRSTMPPDTLRGYRIDELCLEPELLPGDTLIVDTGLTPQIDDFVIVIVGGQPAIKKYEEVGEEHIHGVITDFQRKLRK